MGRIPRRAARGERRAELRARSNGMSVAALELKALYSVGALATAAGVTPYLMLRLLRANGVEFVRAGRCVFVPLSEIEARIPALWRSILAAEGARADARGSSRR
jgi:hypothetical protein